jgi:hypothetical protein
MRDRVLAIGGEILVTPTPSGGILVRGDVPLTRHPPALAALAAPAGSQGGGL